MFLLCVAILEMVDVKKENKDYYVKRKKDVISKKHVMQCICFGDEAGWGTGPRGPGPRAVGGEGRGRVRVPGVSRNHDV